MKAPLIVYKYLSPDGVLPALRKHSVKYTPINEFNDPFEGMLRTFNQEEFENLIQQALEAVQKDSTWRKFCYSSIFADPEELYRCRNDIQSGRMDLACILRVGLDRMSQDVMGRLPLDISKHFCMACFSACYNSILMWSHYARNHEGIVIGYHSRYLGPLTPVQYRSERVPLPVYQFRKNKKSPSESMWHVKALTTKFSAWEYEQEWRGIEQREKLLPKNAKPSDVLYSKVPPQAIASVIMGTRTDEALRSECRSFAKRHSACRLFQAGYHNRDFALVFNPIKV